MKDPTIRSNLSTISTRWSQSRFRLRHYERARTICRVSIVGIQRCSGSTVPPECEMSALRLGWTANLAALLLLVFFEHCNTQNIQIYTIKDVRNLVCGLAVDKTAGPKRHSCMLGT